QPQVLPADGFVMCRKHKARRVHASRLRRVRIIVVSDHSRTGFARTRHPEPGPYLTPCARNCNLAFFRLIRPLCASRKAPPSRISDNENSSAPGIPINGRAAADVRRALLADCVGRRRGTACPSTGGFRPPSPRSPGGPPLAGLLKLLLERAELLP